MGNWVHDNIFIMKYGCWLGEVALKETLYKFTKIGLLCSLITGLLFLVLEGGASLYFAYQGAYKEIEKEPFLAERLHTEYDPLLGWINKPNVFIDHMYGPNVSLKTNSQRFRNQADFTTKVPKGRIRAICSGDSFTLGFGVDNDHTWCGLLETIDPRFQTVNMGQGGYGIDQAYLWYKRNGTQLHHNVQVFAFITPDFARMRFKIFLGMPKPILRLRNREISVENIPVTRLSFHRALKYLRLVNLVRLASEIGAFSLPRTMDKSEIDFDELKELVGAVFDSLKELNETKNSKLLLVHLPSQSEYLGTRSNRFQEFVRHVAEKRGILYLNLVKELRQNPPSKVRKMFFQKNIKGSYGLKGHLTVAGNTFVAKKIYEVLANIDGLEQN